MSRRVNFREVRDRFTHIDADLVSAAFSVDPPSAHLTVRFYPWWEHPLYIKARDTGATWGFRDYSEGIRDVTVMAVHPLECRLSQQKMITDWSFCENHPLTWRFEDQGQILCNSDPDVPRLVEAVLSRHMPCVTRSVLDEYVTQPAWKPPFSLGHFPYTLYHVVRDELEAANVCIHVPRVPEKRESVVAFMFGDDDYILAYDFEMELPEFEHRSEWFEARKRDAIS